MGTSPTFRQDRYDANSANVNRQITVRVAHESAPLVGIANTFLALKGPANQYPSYHQIQGATDVQELGQLRLSLVVRAMTTYAIPVGVHVDSVGGWVDIKYEQDEMGVFFNQDWTGNPALPKHAQDGTSAAGTLDWITDTVGVGGMPRGPKEKRGLNLLLAELSTVSFDGGATGPFGALSTGANIVLPDGVLPGVPVGAPAPALPVVTAAYASGLVASWIGY